MGTVFFAILDYRCHNLTETNNLLCENNVINEAQVMDIFQAEAAIITGHLIR